MHEIKPEELDLVSGGGGVFGYLDDIYDDLKAAGQAFWSALSSHIPEKQG